MSHEPLVSAIVSLYAAERFIVGCLEDLTAQTLGQALEIIVVDACSPQNERAVVARYAERFPNIVFVRAPEREGVYASWNRGIALARGRFVTNANADDRHRSDALEVMARALDDAPAVDFVYGDSLVGTVENETFAANDRAKVMRFPEYFAPATLLYCQLGPQPLWRRAVHERVGLFDADYKACGDWAFNIALAARARGRHIAQTLGLYLERPDAISFRDPTMSRENERIRRRWQNPEAVEERYRAIGVAWETPRENALVHLDMAIRAMRFYPPWGYGRPDNALGFARRCLRHALRLDPELAPARELVTLPDAVLAGLSDLPSPLGLPTQAELAGFAGTESAPA